MFRFFVLLPAGFRRWFVGVGAISSELVLRGIAEGVMDESGATAQRHSTTEGKEAIAAKQDIGDFQYDEFIKKGGVTYHVYGKCI